MAKDKICRPFVGIIAPENKFTVDTIDDLKSRNYLTIGDIVDLNGYYTAGDGAHHKRKIESTDDGSGVQLANGMWANIVHNGEVNVSWFGAKGDGVTDESDIFEKWIGFDTKLILDKNIKISITNSKYTKKNILGYRKTIFNESVLLFSKHNLITDVVFDGAGISLLGDAHSVYTNCDFYTDSEKPALFLHLTQNLSFLNCFMVNKGVGLGLLAEGDGGSGYNTSYFNNLIFFSECMTKSVLGALGAKVCLTTSTLLNHSVEATRNGGGIQFLGCNCVDVVQPYCESNKDFDIKITESKVSVSGDFHAGNSSTGYDGVTNFFEIEKSNVVLSNNSKASSYPKRWGIFKSSKITLENFTYLAPLGSAFEIDLDTTVVHTNTSLTEFGIYKNGKLRTLPPEDTITRLDVKNFSLKNESKEYEVRAFWNGGSSVSYHNFKVVCTNLGSSNKVQIVNLANTDLSMIGIDFEFKTIPTTQNIECAHLYAQKLTIVEKDWNVAI